MDVVIGGQCLLPGLPGLRQFSGGVACVAEVGKNLSFRGAVAVVPAQAERVFKMSDGPGKVIKMKLDVSEGVPDKISEFAVAQLGDKGKRLLAERAGPVVVAQKGVEPTDIA